MTRPLTYVLVLIGVSLLTLSGCGESKTPVAEVRAPEAKEEAAAPAAVEAPEAAPQEVTKTTIAGVPDLNLDLVEVKQSRKANKANKKALKLHRKKKWPGAIAAYIEGLEADPSNILIRFNLGCAYALDGQKDNALAILKQFKETKDCQLCVGRLEKATKDSDYSSLWDDSSFKALTEGAKMEAPDYRALTKKFLSQMGSANWGLLRKGTEAGYGFVYRHGKKSKAKGTVVRNRKDLIKWKVARGGTDAFFAPGESIYTWSLVCKGTCCSVGVSDEDYNYGERGTGAIEEVCYWPISADTAYVRSLKVYLNGQYP